MKTWRWIKKNTRTYLLRCVLPFGVVATIHCERNKCGALEATAYRGGGLRRRHFRIVPDFVTMSAVGALFLEALVGVRCRARRVPM